MNDTRAIAHRCLSLIDLTSLNESDTPTLIRQLCDRAVTRFGPVAAVCVYPEHVAGARAHLDGLAATTVRVATVVNFPDGSADAARAERETRRAVAAGADEIDLVFPWRAFLAGEISIVMDLLKRCRVAASVLPLKVILETGELRDHALIRAAADMAIAEGANFLKTSTGKTPVSATLDAARVLMEAVQEQGGLVGVKISGGVRQVSDAAPYLALADSLLGPGFVDPTRFRFGASALLDHVLGVLAGTDSSRLEGY